MARTYLSTNNSRGSTVTAMSPTFAHFRGWNAGVRVQAVLDKGKPDKFLVYATNGSHGSGSDTLLGTLTETPDGPYWTPATAGLKAGAVR